MNRDQVFSFLAGLLNGSIVGAAAVILLAPQSGFETRQSITGRIYEIIDAGKQAIVERRQELNEEYRARIQIPLHPLEEETA